MKFFSFFLFSGVALSLMFLSSCATFKGPIPVTASGSEYYISPAVQDGIKDQLVFNLEIPQLKGLKLAGYRVQIESEQGEIVYVMEDGHPKPEKKISGKKTPVVIPDEFIWKGQDNDEMWLPDGLYRITAEAWDYYGNSGITEAIPVHIDNRAPLAAVTTPYQIFSPDADERQDTIDIYQKSSSEDLWTGVIKDNNGNIILKKEWKGIVRDFSWNGLNDKGVMASEGIYYYELTSHDKAGNSFKLKLDNISLDLRVFPAQLTVSSTAFSPDGNAVNDTVEITVSLEDSTQFINGSLTVNNVKGNIKKRFRLPGSLKSQTYIFDGKDDEGNNLDEGLYYVLFNANFKNGNNQLLSSLPISLDLTPPQAVLTMKELVFSPEGDNLKDSIEIAQSTSVESIWNGSITNQNNEVVYSRSWEERALSFSWEGKDNDDRPVPDGEYRYSLEAADTAGNTAVYFTPFFKVDTRSTPISIITNVSAISPNGDGIDDAVEFMLKAGIREGIRSWSFIIKDSSGNEAYRAENDNTDGKPVILPEKVLWTGYNTEGQIKEDTYSAVMNVIYQKGNNVTAVSTAPLTLDITPPDFDIKIMPLPFSPDGDGVDELLKVSLVKSSPDDKVTWTAVITDPNGNVFHSIPSSAIKNDVFTWNGQSKKKELVQSASDYTLTVRAFDTTGNVMEKSVVIPVDILVHRDGDVLKISISSIYFKPYKADYLDVDKDIARKNLQVLDRLSQIFNKYPSYQISLEGHALRSYWNNENKWKEEEKNILLPLSKERAESVRDALIQRGIKSTRMSTKGLGSSRPVVPHSDMTNNWKNRRVEFILIR